ncbi:DUF1203 domain-containing protein [Pseudoalteromonas luteoviolacea]|uniref:DUF1203 domain-containing protein n=1 Tax=Pseudoalteromonas luteoviolacea S4054 TaxID=1129367 RepID=A0A0F6AAY0_9GAMM|nr:DUF1203 domain-containing protein [Pseudoalteromonas luteoviolacea]AOT08740.1 hypothetical protein S4054249_13140 [Pseudoalteromonas luteoviolacea]AOT13655.1 hypothetical protein S40542_13115 [Pseudoalteromonas luteoviolacea]AOT18568.1 hypothetical protein S4054_13115 [Pseudoalteromonas luteoviolacea]KKE82564.1 hypothetical protein N479_17830 [Pseudoalteromonas luteoviolacea S4054]KZN64220.1 hypothetical protein N481_25465 [Pseudoalteromonas luteoviolacea S4047-1]
MNYKVVAIRPDFLDKVRNLGIDDQNQPVEILEAKGGEPCRDVLRGAKAGEKLILASYCPFTKAGPYKEYGPVFVLANPESEKFDNTKLPLPSGSETDYLGHTFVLRAYCSNERIIDAKLTSPEQAESDLEEFLANEKVSFVIARYAAYGCYSFRVDRAV